MDRQAMTYTDHFEAVMKAMTSRGLLLGAYDADDRANAMTIGWGMLGSIWSMPMWIVLARPSRYTHQCIEHTGCFSVNVPGRAQERACGVCGSRSGRDGGKLAEAGLTPEKGENVLAPTLAECPIVYECRVVHRNDVLPDQLIAELMNGPYADGDFHRVYFGRILSARAAADAASLIG